MAGNLGGVVKILGGAVIALLQPHVVLGFVEQIFFEAQAVLLRLGPHPFRALADPNRAGLINGHTDGMSAPVNGLICVACSSGTHSHANSAAELSGNGSRTWATVPSLTATRRCARISPS